MGAQVLQLAGHDDSIPQLQLAVLYYTCVWAYYNHDLQQRSSVGEKLSLAH